MPNGEAGQARQVLFIRHSPFVIRHFFSVRLRERAKARPDATAQSFASGAAGSCRSAGSQITRSSAQAAACAIECGSSACVQTCIAKR